jgi:hypothetical protein
VKCLIQAHPARSDLAEGLLECLGEAEIVYDPDPDSPHRSPWRTYRACLERGLSEDAGSVLILQEDVLICGRLLEGVEMAAAARPDRPLAFFVPGKPTSYTNAIYRARVAGAAWAELPLGTWAPVVASLWPAELAARLLAWYDAANLARPWSADDEIVGRFLAQIKTPMLASVPSLVEHPDTEPSVMNGNRRVGDGLDPHRRAYFFIGDDPDYGCDATAINWSS